MELLQALAAVVGGDQPTVYIFTLIGVNFVFALLGAWRMGTFNPRELANVFAKHILPMVGGYYTIRIALYIMGADGPIYAGADGVALAAITTTLVASIWEHWGEMGLPFVEPMNRVLAQAAERLGFSSGTASLLRSLLRSEMQRYRAGSRRSGALLTLLEEMHIMYRQECGRELTADWQQWQRSVKH